jgi:alpha-D-ribose 1-methylphosphonate 5-triphosphate synthase subunit PhnL
LEQDPSEDPIAHLCTRINWSEAASVHLLSGQHGSGKSTGLRRLKQNLERDGHIVFLSDMRDYLNLTTPVEISDFFMAVMGGLSDQVEKFAHVGK